MAKQKAKDKKKDEVPEDEADQMPETEMSELEADDAADAAEEVTLSDIPIEQFLKDPKMSMLTEENDVEETTAWCPVCNDHTIFVDKTCTVCGFVKGTKKAKGKEDEEESTESTFELMPSEEVIDEMSMYGGNGDYDEGSDY